MLPPKQNSSGKAVSCRQLISTTSPSTVTFRGHCENGDLLSTEGCVKKSATRCPCSFTCSPSPIQCVSKHGPPMTKSPFTVSSLPVNPQNRWHPSSLRSPLTTNFPGSYRNRVRCSKSECASSHLSDGAISEASTRRKNDRVSSAAALKLARASAADSSVHFSSDSIRRLYSARACAMWS